MTVFQLGPFIYDAETGVVQGAQEEQRLRHKTNLILSFLIENRDRPVSREEIFELGWDQAVLQDAAVNKSIAEIRGVFGDNAKDSAFLKTIPKLGYQWIAPTVPITTFPPVIPVDDPEPGSVAVTPAPRPNFRFWWLVLAALLVFAVVLWSTFWAGTLDSGPIFSDRGIAILPMENGSGNNKMKVYELGLPIAIAEGLAGEGLKVIPVTDLESWSQSEARDLKGLELSPEDWSELKETFAPTEIVTSTITKEKQTFVFRAKVFFPKGSPQELTVRSHSLDAVQPALLTQLLPVLFKHRAQITFSHQFPKADVPALFFFDGLQAFFNGHYQDALLSMKLAHDRGQNHLPSLLFGKMAAVKAENTFPELSLQDQFHALSEGETDSSPSIRLLTALAKARIAIFYDDRERSAQALAEAIRLQEKVEPFFQGMLYEIRGEAALKWGDYPSAYTFFSEAVRHYEQSPFPFAIYPMSAAHLESAQGSGIPEAELERIKDRLSRSERIREAAFPSIETRRGQGN